MAGVAFAVMSAPGFAANENNAGTVKVHEEGSIGDNSNDPHVACPFYVEGFNMAAASGTITIKSWPPTGDTTVVLEDTWEADGDEPENHFLNGPYTLPSGHYKLFVSDVQHEKQKVFWVECDEEPCPEGQTRDEAGDCIAPCPEGQVRDENGDCVTTTTTTTGTPTEIPFFPSAPAMVIGSVGALGAAFVAFRRKL